MAFLYTRTYKYEDFAPIGYANGHMYDDDSICGGGGGGGGGGHVRD